MARELLLAQGAESLLPPTPLQQLHELLADGINPAANYLSLLSISRILQLNATGWSPIYQVLDDAVVKQLQSSPGDVIAPVVPGLRTVQDFPQGSTVVLRQPETNSKFIVGIVYEGDLQKKFNRHCALVVQIGHALCGVRPTYPGLLTKDEYAFYEADFNIRDRTSSLSYYNFAFTNTLLDLGVGDASDKPTIVRVMRHFGVKL